MAHWVLPRVVAANHTLVLVFERHLVGALQSPAEHALEHEQQLVVRDVLIVHGDHSQVVAQLGFDYELPGQIVYVQESERVAVLVHVCRWPAGPLCSNRTRK